MYEDRGAVSTLCPTAPGWQLEGLSETLTWGGLVGPELGVGKTCEGQGGPGSRRVM